MNQIPTTVINLLDERLLELATSKGGELFFTTEEYELWDKTRRLDHVSRVLMVRDIVSWVSQTTRYSTGRGLAYQLGMDYWID